MTTEPTTAEVVRRLDEISNRLLDLTNQLRTDYLRADLYKAQRESDREDVKDLRTRLDKAEAQAAANRRLILTSLVAPIITALIVLYVSAQVGGR